MSESKTLAGALATFHRSVGTIHKNSKAQYGKYADLADVLSAISTPLADAGLAVTQTFTVAEGQTLLRTTLRHIGGETVDSDMPLVEAPSRGNPLHSWGGSVSYQRRYALLAILNLAAGMEDDDGDFASDAKPPLQQSTPKPAKTVKTTPTPAQTPKPAAKAVESAPAAPVEPPLSKEDKEVMLKLLSEHHEKNREAFDQFSVEYRAHFKVGDRHKLSDHLQTEEHAEFTRQFFDAHPIKKS